MNLYSSFDIRAILGGYSYLYYLGAAIMILGFVISLSMAAYKMLQGNNFSLLPLLAIFVKSFFLFSLYLSHATWAEFITDTVTNGKYAIGVDKFNEVSTTLSKSFNRRMIGAKYEECVKKEKREKTIPAQYVTNDVTGKTFEIKARTVTVEVCLDKDGKEIVENTEKDSLSIFAPVGQIASFLIGLVVIVVLNFLLVVAMVMKTIMFSVIWPIVMKLFLIAFCFAFPLAMLPGGGKILQKSVLTYIEIALWPIIYNIAFGLVAGKMTTALYNLDTVVRTSTTTGALLGNIETIILAVGYVVFLTVLVAVTPKLAHMIVTSEGAGLVGSAIAFGTAAGIMKAADHGLKVAKMAQKGASGIKESAGKRLGISPGGGGGGGNAGSSTKSGNASRNSGGNTGTTANSKSGGSNAIPRPAKNSSGSTKNHWNSVPNDIKSKYNSMKTSNPAKAKEMKGEINRAAGTAKEQKETGQNMYKQIRDKYK